MSLPTLLDPEAEAEWVEAATRYDQMDPGRGAHFNEVVERALDHIGNWPTAHPCVFKDIRMYPLKGYPYVIFFAVEADFVEVISVFHTRRNPRIWQERR